MFRKSHSNTLRLVILAFLIALEILLTRFLSINTPIVRIGFGFLPIAVAAILYGPIWAGAIYALGDILGMMLFPTGGAYFPGFTLSAFFVGAIYGLILHGHEVTVKRSLLASTIVAVFIHLLLNTYWLTILLGQGYLALLPVRIIKCLILIPIEGIIIPLVYNGILKKIPSINRVTN
ncbi:MAG TPA: folate family ECF transporter S component [Anaerovoracaceae bacterium]|nr:folate family ECF transporter S component [Anaerovoracaceae bacterium]